MELGANISKFLEGNHFTGHPNTYSKIGQLQESKTSGGSTSAACQNILVPVQCQSFPVVSMCPREEYKGLRLRILWFSANIHAELLRCGWGEGAGWRSEERQRGGKSLAKDLRPDNFSLRCRQHQQDKSKFPAQDGHDSAEKRQLRVNKLQIEVLDVSRTIGSK